MCDSASLTFMSWLLHFHQLPAAGLGKPAEWPACLGLCHTCGGEASGLGLWPGPALPVVAIWKVKQQMEVTLTSKRNKSPYNVTDSLSIFVMANANRVL